MQLKRAVDSFRRKPASEVTILKVEPGGKLLIARLINGLASSFCNAAQSLALMLGIKVLGSNDGTETIASTSPLLGSTTTAAPRATERIASSAMAWMRPSIVK